MNDQQSSRPDALDVAAYRARTGATRGTAEQWAALYAAEAVARFGVPVTRELSPEQSAVCERAADAALRPRRRARRRL